MIQEKVSLREYNTFRINCVADLLVTIASEKELQDYILTVKNLKEKYLVLGGGSNMLFSGDFRGTIIHPSIKGIDLTKEDSECVHVVAGAGVAWDDLVSWSVNAGYGGLENLSLIPGSVGAVPVQNIGAYGVEAGPRITRVKTINISDGSIKYFTSGECRFGYRDSIFKSELKGRFVVLSVEFRLDKKPEFNLEYGFLRQEVAAHSDLTLQAIREAVIRIRSSKLPDPSVTGNAGSFFKNPVIGKDHGDFLKSLHPLMPVYPEKSGGYKVAAGWLIEQCGWKGWREGDAGVHEKQALVLVNHGNATGNEILALSRKISDSVRDKFYINLEREVEVV